jgi:hypothetical protein
MPEQARQSDAAPCADHRLPRASPSGAAGSPPRLSRDARLSNRRVGGGPPQTLCAGAGRGGAWNRDGVIVFSGGPGPLLRVSSARGASTLYLSSESRPSIRVDGELQMLDGEPVHVARDVESLLLTLMPERSDEALRTGHPVASRASDTLWPSRSTCRR